jgi:hypothetical protein
MDIEQYLFAAAYYGWLVDKYGGNNWNKHL